VSVVEAVRREVESLGPRAAESALAATALALAHMLDANNSATSKAMCAKALNETMGELRSLVPPKREKDDVDDLAAARAKRRAGVPAATDLARP
jgi:hypothetical protein